MRVLTLILIAALVVLTGLAAKAQTACTSLPDALAALSTRYSEVPRMSGLMGNGSLLIITASDRGGWTALIVNPEGMACMAAAGEGLTLNDPPKPGVLN